MRGRTVSPVWAAALGLLTLGVFAGPVEGQNALERQGLWIGFGLGPGFGSLDCDRCGPRGSSGPWTGGAGVDLFLVVGGAARDDLLLGGVLEGWAREDGPERAAIGALSFVVSYYPVRGSGLFLRPSLGVGGARLESPGLELESTGVVGSFGVGWDVPVGRRFALSPYGKVVQVFSEGSTVQTGAGPRVAPDFPRYLSFGLGLHWY